MFTLEATPIKFGPGAVEDAGWELQRLRVTRALLVTDPGVAAAGHADRVRETIEREGIAVVLYERAHVEPDLDSLQEAADFALEAQVDGFVSVGGGSAIDTAKVADLIVSHPAPVMDYVNAPIGDGRAPPGPLKPHLAIPTTSGTGSEATTVAVLDIPERKVKTGISHRYLRPAQAIVDPELARTMPADVAASSGLDVVCHAAESFIAKPYTEREKPATPGDRPPYQGANPVADVWSQQALEYGGRFLRRAVRDPDDTEARGAMMLAASMAGVGFGSAGVHIPHACAYPIAGLKHDELIRHGISVIVTAPAAFRSHVRGRPAAPPSRCGAARPRSRGPGRTAGRAARADGGRRRAGGPRRARLRRGRHPGAGRGRAGAAAAPRGGSAGARRGRPRRDPEAKSQRFGRRFFEIDWAAAM